MATTYSDEITNINATPPVALSPIDHHGKLRVAQVTYEQVANGDAGDLVHLARLPAGRVTLLGPLCNLYINATTASMKIDIGWAAYTNLDGTAVVADIDGLDDNLDAEAAGAFPVGTVSAVAVLGGRKTFESESGVIITLTMVTDVVAGDDVNGYLVYVSD